jgi:adenylate cyclase class IV
LFKDVEIAIDNVKELGSFIELEAMKHFGDPKQGKEYLYAILKELNAELGEECFRGYPFKLLEKKGHKFG